MGKRRRGPINLPGPAHYAYDDKLYRTGRHIGPHYSIKGRFDQSLSDTPGPGHYNPKHIFKSISYTIGTRPKSLKHRFRPGPADYTYPSYLLRTGKAMGNKHSIQPRRDEPKSDNPDPAQYNPIDDHKPQSVTILGKPKDSKPPTGPTATTYDIDPALCKDGTHKTETHTIGVRRSDKSLSKVPPPGTYDPKYPQDHRSITFRKGRLDFPIDDNPGPGTYDVKKTFVDTNGFELGKRIPSQPHSGVGPAHYSFPADLIRTGRANIRNSMIHNRLKPVLSNNIPSPTRYNVGSAVMRKTKKAPPAFSFQGGREHVFDNNPPPGNYTIREHPLRTFTYKPGLSERNSYIPRNTNPSPTKYEINDAIFDKIRKAKPTFTIRGRSEDVLASDAPGPGTYMQDIDKYGVGGKGVSRVAAFGKKYKHPDYDCSPGPAIYDPDPMIGKTIRSTKPTLPQYTFGRKYDTVEMDFVDTPGPGAYPVVDLRKTPTGWIRTGPN